MLWPDWNCFLLLLKCYNSGMDSAYKIISFDYGKGANSSRILIEDATSKKLLKFTDLREDYFDSAYTPKLFSVNSPKYAKLNKCDTSYIYEYEFIDGFLLRECAVDDELFLNLIKMLVFFFSSDLFVWDCHIDNIIVKNKKPYFVDFGGIKKQPFTERHYIFDFDPYDCPEEFSADNYPESYNTETFTIYWLADQLIKRCKCIFSKKATAVLTKMHSTAIKNRYISFNVIVKELLNSSLA